MELNIELTATPARWTWWKGPDAWFKVSDAEGNEITVALLNKRDFWDEKSEKAVILNRLEDDILTDLRARAVALIPKKG